MGRLVGQKQRLTGLDCSLCCDTLKYMAKKADNEPLTVKDIHETLIPAMQKIFAARKDLERNLNERERRLYTIALEALKEREMLSPINWRRSMS